MKINSITEAGVTSFKDAFAAGRKAALAGGPKTFQWTDPKTGKLGTYGTDLKKPAADQANTATTQGTKTNTNLPTIASPAPAPKPAAAPEINQVDQLAGDARDIAGAGVLGGLASQLPKVPGAIKAIGKRVLPGANMAYQGLDSAKRATAGDSVGSAIAAASMHPYLAIPGAIVQAGRDKVRTGSFMPDDEEIAAAAKKDKEAGGYWKSQGSNYDPSYMPESKIMKSNRLQTAIIKEELELKKCSMTEEQIRNTLFIYKDRRGNLFTESGKHIDAKRLDEAPAWLKAGVGAAKTGWNALKTGGEWAAKNIPPAYQATKAGLGKAADEIGSVGSGIIDRAGKVGGYAVDKTAQGLSKVKQGVQDVYYDSAERVAKLAAGRAQKTADKIDDLTIQNLKIDNKNKERLGKAQSNIPQAQADEINAKTPMDWKPGKKAAIGALVGTDVVKGTDIHTDDAGNVTDWDYLPVRGLARTARDYYDAAVKEDQTFSLGDYLFGKKKPPAPAPVKPEVKPEVKPDPAKPEPPKPEPKPKPAEEPDYTVNADPRTANVPYTPRVQPKTGNEKVIAMQKKLKAAGYDLGNFGPEGDGIDGKWGKRTQAAYDAYMADQKLKQAGEPDAASRERERIAAQSNLQQAPQGSDTTTYGDQSSVKPEVKPDDPIGDMIKQKQDIKPTEWKSRNPQIAGVFESDLNTILKLAGRK